MPLARAGDDPATLVLDALARTQISLQPGDAIVVAQKIVSKCEGRLVPLASIVASPEAQALAERTRKDPRWWN